MSLITLDYPSDENITIGREKKKVKYKVPPFITYGKLGMSKYKISGMDTTSIFLQLSPGATWLWWTLVSLRSEKSNMAVLKSKSLTKAQQNKLSKSYKELEEHRLVKKTRKEHYLLNPTAVLPFFENFEEVESTWQQEVN